MEFHSKKRKEKMIANKANATGRIEDDAYAIGALLAIYNNQTKDEKKDNHTKYDNGVGFNGADAQILTSLSKHYLAKGWLSPKQLSVVKNKLPKYNRQLENTTIIPRENKSFVSKTKTSNDLKIKPHKKGMAVYFDWDADLLDKVKTLSGRRYDAANRCWIVPVSIDNLNALDKWGFNTEAVRQKQSGLLKTGNSGDFDGGIQISLSGGELYSFQKQGVQFIESRNGRALIGDEMGLGKTIQALAWLSRHAEALPTLVVCPSTLKLNWKKEIDRWLPDIPVSILSGKTATKLYTHTKSISIINYDIMNAWQSILEEQKFKTIILDECHLVKNKNALRTKATRAVAKGISYVLALSGTPIINRPVEMFNAINLVDPVIFPNFWDYAKRYCAAKRTRFGWDFEGASNKQELHRKLTDTIMIRRLKKDVLPQLPNKIRTIIPLELTNAKEYNAAEQDFINWLSNKEGRDVAEKAAQAEKLVRTEKLKQLAINGKFSQVVSWIKDFLDTGEKLIVFCTHRDVIDMLMRTFQKVAVKVDGSVSNANRQKAVDDFQEKKPFVYFLETSKLPGWE